MKKNFIESAATAASVLPRRPKKEESHTQNPSIFLLSSPFATIIFQKGCRNGVKRRMWKTHIRRRFIQKQDHKTLPYAKQLLPVHPWCRTFPTGTRFEPAAPQGRLPAPDAPQEDNSGVKADP
jgi:hypothetical protein